MKPGKIMVRIYDILLTESLLYIIMILAFHAVGIVISLLFDFVFNILWGHLK